MSDLKRLEVLEDLRKVFPKNSRLSTIDLILLLVQKGVNPDLVQKEGDPSTILIDGLEFWVYKPDGSPYTLENEPSIDKLQTVLDYIQMKSKEL